VTSRWIEEGATKVWRTKHSPYSRFNEFKAKVDEPRNASAKEQLHDVETIARQLGVSSKTVRRMIERGELGHYRVGHLLRISEVQVQEYLARSRRGR
jgi:excisionase family DNA binding protein